MCNNVIYLLLYSPDYIQKTIFICKTLFKYIYTVAGAHSAPAIIVPASQEQRLFMIGRSPRKRIKPVSKWLFFQYNHLRALRVRGISLTKTLKCSENVASVSFRIARDN